MADGAPVDVLNCNPGTDMHPQFPAASPYVTAVGATGLTPSTVQYDLTRTPRSSICAALARNYLTFSSTVGLDTQVQDVLLTVTSWLSKEALLLGPFCLLSGGLFVVCAFILMCCCRSTCPSKQGLCLLVLGVSFGELRDSLIPCF